MRDPRPRNPPNNNHNVLYSIAVSDSPSHVLTGDESRASVAILPWDSRLQKQSPFGGGGDGARRRRCCGSQQTAVSARNGAFVDVHNCIWRSRTPSAHVHTLIQHCPPRAALFPSQDNLRQRLIVGLIIYVPQRAWGLMGAGLVLAFVALCAAGAAAEDVCQGPVVRIDCWKARGRMQFDLQPLPARAPPPPP